MGECPIRFLSDFDVRHLWICTRSAAKGCREAGGTGLSIRNTGTFPAVAAFAVAALGPLVALAGLNDARADDFTVVRGGSASLLFRTFVADRIVEPDNGEASDELARAVSRELLSYQPYRSRGIDLEKYF